MFGLLKMNFGLVVLTATMLAGFLAPFVDARIAHADSRNLVCDQIYGTGPDCKDPDGEPTVFGGVSTAIEVLSMAAATICVILVIIGGVRYITAVGDPQSASKARRAIIYALIGLVLVAISQLLVGTIVGQLDT